MLCTFFPTLYSAHQTTSCYAFFLFPPSKWPKTWVKVIAASGWVIAAIGFFGNYSGLKVFSNDVVAKLAFEIDKNAVYVPLTSSETFVPRDDLENRVNNALTRQESQRCYHVIFGPKGVGKSAIVDKCAKGRRGVIKVVVTDSNTKKDVVGSVLRQLGYPSSDTNIDSEMLLKAVQLCKHKPILIFDIERGGGATVNSDAIQAVRSMAKVCAATCVCVIILSEASAVVEFGKDRSREEFLYVNEMTHEEGKQLLRSRGASFSERQLDYIFHNIGTSPAMLEKLMYKVPLDVTLEQFVEEEMREARKDLQEFSHQPILDALKKHPDGVSLDAFLGVQDDGAKLWKPREVARAMVDSNAIVYRMETDQYQLMSTAHRTALLKTFKPLAKE